MIKITEIDPDKKYVLQFNEPIADDQRERLKEKLDRILEQDEVTLIIIAGDELTIVPAEQVIGHVPFEKGDE